MTASFDPFAGPTLSLAIPTTEAQRELIAAVGWSEDASRAFNQPFMLRLSGPLVTAALSQALAGVVARHQALRAVVTPDGGTLCILHEGSIPLVHADVSQLAGTAQTEALSALVTKVAEDTFDLVRGPLLRATLVCLAPQEHVLICCSHHVVCDGWSIGVLVRDLARLYSAAVHQQAQTPSRPGLYSDYVLRELERQASSDGRADVAFWRALYQKRAPQLELPLDFPRPKVKTYHAHRLDRALNPELMHQLKLLAGSTDSSLFTVLLAAFAAWIMRHTNQDEVVIGIPSAGQAINAEPELIGHCVNLLPLLLGLQDGESFTELLQRTRSRLLDALDHQRFTYGTLLKSLALPRDAARNPLVAVLFNVENGIDAEDLAFTGLSSSCHSIARGAENFELFVSINLGLSGATVECQYNTDLFAAATIGERLASFEQLLSDVVKQPHQSVRLLQVLTPASRDKVLRGWNQTACAKPQARSVHELFESQALATPSKVAVTAKGGTTSLTYAALNRQADRLAHHLVARGVNPGSMVGIALERDTNLLVGLLGILKAGAAYVPIDAGYPKERLQWIFADTLMPAIVTTARIAEQLPPNQASVIRLDADLLQQTSGGGDSARLFHPSGADLAYVIFTSGSTGRPKGVLVPHHSVVNFLHGMRQRPGITAADTLLAVTTVAFDIHVLELFLPLICGATVALASTDEVSDPERLGALLNRVNATMLQATPATWRMLLAAGWSGKKGLKGLCGGERLTSELAEALLTRIDALWNMYGPTETTVWSTCGEIKSAANRITIGTPIANTTVYIVDAHLEPVPVGTTGELMIGGDGVTLGYLHRPELTAAAFIRDPFATRSDALMYRTGDLARFTIDGEIECLGRRDHQVKVRGYRIELGDIESAMIRHSGVAQAVCDVRQDKSGDPRLVLWYVAKPSQRPPAAALRVHLQESLPDYMVPQLFMAVTSLPLTPNGKVDRKALPSPFQDELEDAQSYVAPGTSTERILAATLARLLGRPQVSATTHLYELGGDEDTVAALAQQLNHHHGMTVSPRDIYANPTVATLAAWIDRSDDQPSQDSPAEDLTYWCQQLRQLPAALRLKESTRSDLDSSSDDIPYIMPTAMLYTLTSLAKDAGASLFTLLLAAYNVLLMRHSAPVGLTELLIDIPVPSLSSADHPSPRGAAKRIIVRNKFSGADQFTSLLRQVRNTTIAGLSHDTVSLQDIGNALGFLSSGDALSQASFTWDSTSGHGMAERHGDYTGPHLQLAESTLGFTASLTLPARAQTEDTGFDLLKSFHALLLSIIDQPSQSLAELQTEVDHPQLQELRLACATVVRIETVTKGHPLVQDCAALVMHGLSQAPRLHVYYTLKPQAHLTATDLRLHLSSSIDLRSIKPLYIEIDSFPLTSSGSIDKNNLPTAFQGGSTDATAQQPKSPIALSLAAIWSHLLGHQHLDTNSNFFELGGHSLLAVQMISRVEQEWGIKLSRMAVTLNTLGQIAATISKSSAPASTHRSDIAAPEPRGSFTARLLTRLRRRVA